MGYFIMGGLILSPRARYLRMLLPEALLLWLKLLALLAVANGAPLVGRALLRDRFAWPLDAGVRFLDGRPLFGASKTIRGVLLALIFTPLASSLLGLGPMAGVQIAAGAMLGDLVSSFTKRRLGRPPSSQAPGLDQIPESLVPLLTVHGRYARSRRSRSRGWWQRFGCWSGCCRGCCTGCTCASRPILRGKALSPHAAGGG